MQQAPTCCCNMRAARSHKHSVCCCSSLSAQQQEPHPALLHHVQCRKQSTHLTRSLSMCSGTRTTRTACSSCSPGAEAPPCCFTPEPVAVPAAAAGVTGLKHSSPCALSSFAAVMLSKSPSMPSTWLKLQAAGTEVTRRSRGEYWQSEAVSCHHTALQHACVPLCLKGTVCLGDGSSPSTVSGALPLLSSNQVQAGQDKHHSSCKPRDAVMWRPGPCAPTLQPAGSSSPQCRSQCPALCSRCLLCPAALCSAAHRAQHSRLPGTTPPAAQHTAAQREKVVSLGNPSHQPAVALTGHLLACSPHR